MARPIGEGEQPQRVCRLLPWAGHRRTTMPHLQSRSRQGRRDHITRITRADLIHPAATKTTMTTKRRASYALRHPLLPNLGTMIRGHRWLRVRLGRGLSSLCRLPKAPLCTHLRYPNNLLLCFSQSMGYHKIRWSSRNKHTPVVDRHTHRPRMCRTHFRTRHPHRLRSHTMGCEAGRPQPPLSR